MARAPSSGQAVPAAHAAGPLTLVMGLSGNARAALSSDGRSLTFNHAGETLRYGGLSATDAKGRALHSWLQLRSGRLELLVDTRGAHFPLRIDPLIQGPPITVGATKGDEIPRANSVSASRSRPTATRP